MVASIEAPFAFLEKPVKTLLLDTIKFAHMAFGLVPEILDPVDGVLFIGKQFRVVHAHVMKVRDIQRVVRPEGIGINDTIRAGQLKALLLAANQLPQSHVTSIPA